MALPSGLKLGALGGPNTFGGQAAERLRELYPEFTEIVFFPTSEQSMDWGGVAADAACRGWYCRAGACEAAWAVACDGTDDVCRGAETACCAPDRGAA